MKSPPKDKIKVSSLDPNNFVDDLPLNQRAYKQYKRDYKAFTFAARVNKQAYFFDAYSED